MNGNLKILILEDDRDDAFLTETFLRNKEFNAEFIHVATKTEYETALKEKRPDIILSDHRLNVYTSREALHFRNEVLPYSIFILVTGAVSEEFAVLMLKEGANDYVLKTKMQRLPVAIENALQIKELEKAALKANERFGLAAAASKDVIVDYDYATRTMYVSPAFEKYGYSSGEELPHDTVFKHIHPEDAQQFMERYKQFIDSKEERLNLLFRFIKADGSIAYINLSSILLVNEHHLPHRIISVLHDTTDIHHLQNTLLERDIQHQKKIAETTVDAQEKERKELAKELHDNIGQLLATAKLLLETGMKHPELLEATLAESHETILIAIRDTRNLSHAIMPPDMDEDLFVQKIKELANSVSKTANLEVRCLLPQAKKLKDLSSHSKLAIYRIVQEQLTNILKYSKATQGSIELKTDGFITLVVEDNGVGFDVHNWSPGLGLTNIKNRAEILNGSMQVLSSPGQGTKLSVKIPVIKKRGITI